MTEHHRGEDDVTEGDENVPDTLETSVTQDESEENESDHEERH